MKNIFEISDVKKISEIRAITSSGLSNFSIIFKDNKLIFNYDEPISENGYRYMKRYFNKVKKIVNH
jgi:hypothetical protein